jgi:hypothetical protein
MCALELKIPNLMQFAKECTKQWEMSYEHYYMVNHYKILCKGICR